MSLNYSVIIAIQGVFFIFVLKFRAFTLKEGNTMEALSFPPEEKQRHGNYMVHFIGFTEATG